MRIAREYLVVHSPSVTSFWRRHPASTTAANPKRYNRQVFAARHAYLEKHQHELTPRQYVQLRRAMEVSWREDIADCFYSNDYRTFAELMKCRNKYLSNPKVGNQ